MSCNYRAFFVLSAVWGFPLMLAGCQSLVLSPGASLKITVPALPPFTTLSSTRVEYRLHSWTTPAKYSTLFTLGNSPGSPFLNFVLAPTNEICVEDLVDSAPQYGNWMCADITGVPDVVVRLQRDTVNKQIQYEVRTAQNIPLATYCGFKQYSGNNKFACPIQTVAARSWQGTAEIGDQGSAATAQLAWLKWYSSLVPAGSGALIESTPADLADWRFEGNLNEAAAGTVATLQGVPSFSPTPSYVPACSAGQQQTLRAGYPAQLDGSASYPLDGGTALAYFWQELSGPSTVAWSGNPAQPTVTGLVFGSYIFQLTVTDSSNQSSTCSVKDGAVASDDNGVVITNNPSVDLLIGPQIRFGANPWPWFDDRHRAAADLQNKNLDIYYTSYWDTPAAGMVTVTQNSYVVTGIGTTFTTMFCQGPQNPHVPKATNPGVIAWHPTGVAGQTGRRWLYVASCQSDTQLTTTQPWTPDLAGGTMAYGYADEQMAGTWVDNGDPVNFYDNVVGFYTLYYRSGLDDYQIAAQKLADRFWLSPRTDQGASCELGSYYCTFPRNLSTLGLFLRALDGRPDMWPGLRAMLGKPLYDMSYFGQYNMVQDAREQGYELATVTYCALVDPDANSRATCKAAISKSFANAWTPYQGKDGNWPALWYGGYNGATGFSSWDTHTTVTLDRKSVV